MDQKLIIASDVASGVEYLHSLSILHRDLSRYLGAVSFGLTRLLSLPKPRFLNDGSDSHEEMSLKQTPMFKTKISNATATRTMKRLGREETNVSDNGQQCDGWV